MLLIVFAVFRAFTPTVVARANTVLLIRGILWRQVTVVAQHLAQICQRRRRGNMADLPGDRIDWQIFRLRKAIDPVTIRQHYVLMRRTLSPDNIQLPAMLTG